MASKQFCCGRDRIQSASENPPEFHREFAREWAPCDAGFDLFFGAQEGMRRTCCYWHEVMGSGIIPGYVAGLGAN